MVAAVFSPRFIEEFHVDWCCCSLFLCGAVRQLPPLTHKEKNNPINTHSSYAAWGSPTPQQMKFNLFSHSQREKRNEFLVVDGGLLYWIVQFHLIEQISFLQSTSISQSNKLTVIILFYFIQSKKEEKTIHSICWMGWVGCLLWGCLLHWNSKNFKLRSKWLYVLAPALYRRQPSPIHH